MNMDSANSGSLQSSSGGDEEYDSRGESISSFLNPTRTHFSSLSGPNPNLIQSQPPPPGAFFDASTFANPLYNLDSILQRNLRSDPDPLLGPRALAQGPIIGPPLEPDPSRLPVKQADGAHGPVAKNPKKRTRASRRAPTTVLTTDTTNFRQMVQEFTGIPATPFAAGNSPFSRLPGGVAVAGRAGMPFPLRPSPVFRAAAIDAVGGGNANYEFTKQPQNLLNLQNPIFSFQSLPQHPLDAQLRPDNQPLLNPSVFSEKSDQGNSSLNPLGDGPRQTDQSLGSGGGHSSSSAGWKGAGGQDEQLGNFEGSNGNSQNVRGYSKLGNLALDFQQKKSLESVVSSSRVDQGNVDAWICPSD